MRSRFVLVTLVTLLCGCSWQAANGQTLPAEDPIETLAKALAKNIAADSPKKPNVTVLDFTNMNDQISVLGKYLALELANNLVNLKGVDESVEVVDRANLERLMSENKLTAEGLLNPEEAKKLGNFAGVDAFLIGNLSVQGDVIKVLVRAISTDTSKTLASGKATLPLTDDFRSMLGEKVSSGSAARPNSGGATSEEGETIATKEVGPINATLRSVTEVQLPHGKVTTPGIRCIFVLENRSLVKSVAVAANRTVEKGGEPEFNGYLGALTDSTKRLWRLSDVRPISGIAAFEASRGYGGWKCNQGDPGAAASHVLRGTNWDDRVEEKQTEKNFWRGSFAVIDPGEKIDLVVTFESSGNSDQRGRPVSAETSRPESFQLTIELLLGTFVNGEVPAKSKDLDVLSLTIDKVNLPGQQPKPEP